MKCKICRREIPESTGECVFCSEGIMEFYEQKMRGDNETKTSLD